MRPSSSADILETLPAVTRGDVGMYFLDVAGEIKSRHGRDDGLTAEQILGGLESALPDGRCAIESAIGQDGERVVVTFDADGGAEFERFLEALLQEMTEKDQFELDMESMYSSSLALLEEVSMVGEVMTSLSAGATDEEVAQIGLEALLVAASVERAIYARYDPALARCEVIVQVVMDSATRKPIAIPYTGEAWVDAGHGIIGEAIRGTGTAIMAGVPQGGFPGASGRPENLARSEVIAVPVRYGYKHDVFTLGVLLVMDKRATSYSNVVHLGSQESKMATAIASMVGSTLGNRMVAEFTKELKLCTEIQQQILPDRPARVPGFDLAGRCETSGGVGGDYFDYLLMADGRTLAVVADVSGHNLASGMLMVGARSTLRLLASKHDKPDAIFNDLADSLFEDLSRTERFITAVGAALSPDSGRIEIVNAGHNNAMLFRAKSRRIQLLPSDGTILGFLHGLTYHSRKVEMRPGDVLLLYTDGVTEATDATGKMFEEQRLKDVLRGVVGGTAGEILSSVFTAVEDFTDSAEKGDDITAVVVKRLGTGTENDA